MEPWNPFQGTNSASLCVLAGRYDYPIPTLCLAPIVFLKIPALHMETVGWGKGEGVWSGGGGGGKGGIFSTFMKMYISWDPSTWAWPRVAPSIQSHPLLCNATKITDCYWSEESFLSLRLLSWLTNSALAYEPKCGGRGGVAESQPMSTDVHRSPK